MVVAVALALQPNAVQGGEAGYQVLPKSGGVAIMPLESVDRAPRLSLPLRFRSIDIAGLPNAVRARVETRVRALARSGTVADVFAAAQVAEAEMGVAGYALCRIVVPAQTISDRSVVRLDVVDVRIEALDLDGMPSVIGARARDRLDALIGRSFLESAVLARAIGLLQLDLGVPIRTETRPGSRADRIRLRVSGPARPWTGEVNRGTLDSRPFAHDLLTGNATSYLPADLGRITLAGTVGTRSEKPSADTALATAIALWSIPLNLDVTDLGGSFAEFGIISTGVRMNTRDVDSKTEYDYTRLIGRFGLPLIVAADESLAVKVGLDLTKERLIYRNLYPFHYIGDQRDDTGVLRAELGWVRRYGDVTLEANVGAGVGSTRAHRNVTIADTMAGESRERPIGLTAAQARATVPLPWSLTLVTQARLQLTAFGPLPLSEQFQLFRSAELSAYDPETEQGDSGAVARVEIGRRFPIDWALPGLSVTPYAFMGGGGVWNFVAEAKSPIVIGRSSGLGSRVSLPGTAAWPYPLDLGCELYRQVSSGFLPNYSGLTLRAQLKF